jgi:uncharacterized RDD family membrane protein YckC
VALARADPQSADLRPRFLGRRSPAPTSTVAYAGLVTRGIALVIDGLLIDAAALAVAGAVLLLESIFAPSGRHHVLGVAAGAVLFAVWAVVYFTAFWSSTGQTPGSRVMQIQVTRSDGSSPGVGRALIRLVWMVLSLPLLWGYLLVLFTPRRRAAFDLAAGTVVTIAPSLPALAPLRRGAQSRGIEPPSTVP